MAQPGLVDAAAVQERASTAVQVLNSIDVTLGKQPEMGFRHLFVGFDRHVGDGVVASHCQFLTGADPTDQAWKLAPPNAYHRPIDKTYDELPVHAVSLATKNGLTQVRTLENGLFRTSLEEISFEGI